MSRRLAVSILAVSFIAIAGVGILCAYTELDTATAIRAEGQIPFTPGQLLDDFRYAAPVNLWNTVTGTFDSTDAATNPVPATCTASYVATTGTTSNGNCLKLDFDVTNTGAFAGYVSQLGGAQFTGAGSNPTSNAVSFWVKGVTGKKVFFKAQLKNNSTTLLPYNTTQYYRNTASVYITDYLDGEVTTTWQKVTIPFHNFANLDGLNSMKELIIVFENSSCTINGSDKSGTVYIDDIEFENITIPPAVRVDHFGDKIGICALGGGIGASDAAAGLGGYILTPPGETGPAAIFEPVTGAYAADYPQANLLHDNVMRLDYNVNSGWAFAFLVFGGGQDIDPDPATNKSGWIPIPHDFSAYNTLFISIRGRSASENPKTIKIELIDSGGTKNYVIAGITTEWRRFKISLDSFTILKRESIQQMTFTLEGWRIDSAGGSKVGTVFIDSVQFEYLPSE